MENSQNANLDYKSLIQKITENGDLLVLASKGSGKSTLMMWLARQLMKDESNRVVIIETFPKWIHEFDTIPYMAIKNDMVQSKEGKAYLEENKSYIQWSKDYNILNEIEILQYMKENRNCLFMVECEEMEQITAFMSFIIYTVYRKQYLRAKANTLETVKENFWFLIEESHNLLDSSTIQKKTFQRLRKEQNEFRNLKMHLICVALRLQDLNPKIRSKMSILLSRVSLDDYQLKVRNLLRNSQYRDIITELPKGEFIFPETNQKLTTEPFIQEGKPFLWKPKERPIKTQPRAEVKEALLLRYLRFIAKFSPFGNSTDTTEQSTEEENEKEDELDDALIL
jgi:hypothetical protein